MKLKCVFWGRHIHVLVELHIHLSSGLVVNRVMNMYVDKVHSRHVCLNYKQIITLKDQFATITMMVHLPHIVIVEVLVIFGEIFCYAPKCRCVHSYRYTSESNIVV